MVTIKRITLEVDQDRRANLRSTTPEGEPHQQMQPSSSQQASITTTISLQVTPASDTPSSSIDTGENNTSTELSSSMDTNNVPEGSGQHDPATPQQHPEVSSFLTAPQHPRARIIDTARFRGSQLQDSSGISTPRPRSTVHDDHGRNRESTQTSRQGIVPGTSRNGPRRNRERDIRQAAADTMRQWRSRPSTALSQEPPAGQRASRALGPIGDCPPRGPVGSAKPDTNRLNNVPNGLNEQPEGIQPVEGSDDGIKRERSPEIELMELDPALRPAQSVRKRSNSDRSNESPNENAEHEGRERILANAHSGPGVQPARASPSPAANHARPPPQENHDHRAANNDNPHPRYFNVFRVDLGVPVHDALLPNPFPDGPLNMPLLPDHQFPLMRHVAGLDAPGFLYPQLPYNIQVPQGQELIDRSGLFGEAARIARAGWNFFVRVMIRHPIRSETRSGIHVLDIDPLPGVYVREQAVLMWDRIVSGALLRSTGTAERLSYLRHILVGYGPTIRRATTGNWIYVDPPVILDSFLNNRNYDAMPNHSIRIPVHSELFRNQYPGIHMAPTFDRNDLFARGLQLNPLGQSRPRFQSIEPRLDGESGLSRLPEYQNLRGGGPRFVPPAAGYDMALEDPIFRYLPRRENLRAPHIQAAREPSPPPPDPQYPAPAGDSLEEQQISIDRLMALALERHPAGDFNTPAERENAEEAEVANAYRRVVREEFSARLDRNDIVGAEHLFITIPTIIGMLEPDVVQRYLDLQDRSHGEQALPEQAVGPQHTGAAPVRGDDLRGRNNGGAIDINAPLSRQATSGRALGGVAGNGESGSRGLGRRRADLTGEASLRDTIENAGRWLNEPVYAPRWPMGPVRDQANGRDRDGGNEDPFFPSGFEHNFRY